MSAWLYGKCFEENGKKCRGLIFYSVVGADFL